MRLKILYIKWDCFCTPDLLEAFSHLDCDVSMIEAPEEDKFELQEDFSELLEEKIRNMHPAVVFSMNFFPSASVACNNTQTRYISWIYDNPQTAAYHRSAQNDCNFIFTFDSYMVDQLRSRGVEHIFYAPLAVNAKRMKRMHSTVADREKYRCDIAFVGSLYNEERDFYSIILSRAKDERFCGYLEGLLNAQKLVYGYNFMSELLTGDVIETFHKAGAYRDKGDLLITEAEIYSDVYLSRKLATINRVELLYLLGNHFDVDFYTYKETIIPNVNHKGTISYYKEMPTLFQVASINLNDTRRSIKNGIPLRAMDIMGCGGFLLSNYQEDFFRHFEPDKHMVLYGSIQEAIEKSAFYLSHDAERKRIKKNAYDIMSREHTYEIRLGEMFDIAGVKR